MSWVTQLRLSGEKRLPELHNLGRHNVLWRTSSLRGAIVRGTTTTVFDLRDGSTSVWPFPASVGSHDIPPNVATVTAWRYVRVIWSTFLGWWGRLIASVCPLAATLGTTQRHNRSRALHSGRRRITVDYSRGYEHPHVRFGCKLFNW